MFGDAPGVGQTYRLVRKAIDFRTREQALDPGVTGLQGRTLSADLAAWLDWCEISSADLRSLPFGDGGMKEEPPWCRRLPVPTRSISMDVPDVV